MALNFYSTVSENLYNVTIEGHTYKLSETDTQKVINLVLSLTNQHPVASKLHNPTKRTVASASNKKYPPAKDAEVKMQVSKDGKQVRLTEYNPKDVWGCLKASFEGLDGKYDKESKVITFTAKAKATQFIKDNKVVTADRREEIRKGWNK